ncbi:MAG: hypothetical protein NZ553_05430 [Caldilinea sp.]|nr:hypothetical protein [Caldilinea sp.]MDW8439900.1 imelysin family protein [Caldilineaceae bacterium]
MQRFFICVLAALFLLAGCDRVTPAATTEASKNGSIATVDLSEIKRYLQTNVQALQEAASALVEASDRYYALASEADFDYVALWRQRRAEAVEALTAARTAWMTASPLYEKVEGIVAGTPALATFDVILDAGASGKEDPENAAPIDLTLPDGRVLSRPGNLFGVTESTLWGTDPDYVFADVMADWNGDGALAFGEVAPDANVLKGGADALHRYTVELAQAVEAWEPSIAEAFTALIVMTPTMSEYFASWRDSRFVSGEASTQRDFVAISRLADIQDILSGLEVVYAQVRPLAETVNPEQAAQIAGGLSELKSFVADIYAQEQGGRRYTPEEADILGAEAQNRATAITGQISQIAAELGIELIE